MRIQEDLKILQQLYKLVKEEDTEMYKEREKVRKRKRERKKERRRERKRESEE